MVGRHVKSNPPYIFLGEKNKTMTAKVGEEKGEALDKEYVLLVKDGIEVYVNTNMELHVRLVK